MGKREKNKKFKINPLAVVALVLCALIAVYCGTTAWITGGEPINPIRFVQLQDFSYDISVTGANFDTDGTIVFTKDTINNIGNVKVNVTQSGSGIAYVRFRISHEWLKADGTRLQGDLNLPFTLAENLYDNREVDGYIYYMGTMPVGESVELVTGFDSASFDASAFDNEQYAGLKLKVDVSVGAVQFNRYRQIWGVNKLPWRS